MWALDETNGDDRWATDVLENGVAAACAQYGIPLVAYSPIGRGMLSGQYKTIDDIPADSVSNPSGPDRIAYLSSC